MNLKALNKANIDNLTGLWKKMGTQPSARPSMKLLNASLSWPNRYWFDWDTDTYQISAMQDFPIELPRNSIIPIWGGVAESTDYFEQILIENGFAVVFEQTAMYLNLESYVAIENQTSHIARIHSQQDIETWAHVSGAAFGYEIDVSVIHNIADDPNIQLFMAYNEGQAAATAMLYKTADIIGVHQVGVAEEYQRKGIAYSLMQYVIEACNTWQGKFVTLQASEAGEVLYKRLGFKPQFIIRNYQRI